jgi:hypothetical protein
MSILKNHSALMGRLSGAGGDYYIGTQAVSDKKFEVIRIGSQATLVGVQVGNQDVMTDRNYPALLPTGYLICAEGNEPINYISISAGWAEGFLMPTWVEELPST